jgi:hypothetical protein
LTSPYLLDSTSHKLNFTGTWTVPTAAATGNAATSLIYSSTASGTCSATAAGPSTVSTGPMPGQTTFYAKPPAITPTATGSNNSSGNLTIAFTPASNPNDSSTYVVDVHDLTTDTYANDVCPGNHGPATTAQSCTYAGVLAHSYQAQVVSTNSFSSTTGAWSSTATPSGLSSAPTLNSATANSNGTVSLTWSAPTNLNGATIASYTATATDQATSTNQSWAGISGAATSYTTAGTLTAGHTYSFKITANESTSPSTIDSNTISGVTIYTAPAAPTGVSVTAGNNQGTINWTAPANTGGTPITSYTISVTNTFTNNTTVITGVAASPYVVTGLTNGQAETAKVAAVNSIGTGGYSSNAAFTPTGPPTAGPTTVTATAGNTTVALSWSQLTAGQLNGATVSGYTATVADSTTPANGGQTCTTATAGTTNCTISGLTNGDTYTASVVANTNYGPSPATNSSGFIPAGPPGAPGAPSATVNALAITITWTPPAANGSPITGYVLSYASGGSGTACTTTTSTSCTVNTPASAWGTSYTFTVHAINTAGTGSESSPSGGVTTYTTPLAPLAPGAVQAPAGAHVTWTAPSARGSAITSYTVVATDTTTAGTSQITVAGNLLAADFTGLTVGDAYTVTVSASNAAGSGPASPSSSTVFPYGAPSQMSAPTVLSTGDSTATIGWTAPDLASYTGTPNYVVTAADQTHPAAGGQSCNGNGTGRGSTCVLNGLVNGDNYTVTATVTDPAGTSPPSPPSTVFTTIGVPGAPGAPSGAATDVNSAQITLGTAAPSNGATITRYTITATDTTLGSTAGTCTVTLPAANCSISGLVAAHTFTFTATATNTAGTGPASPASAALVIYGTATPPASVTASAGIKNAALTWPAATAQGTPTTGYTALAIDATAANRGGQTCTAPPDTLSCTVTGLAAADSYTFEVAAINKAGTSPYSAPSNAVTPFDTADPPTGVTAVAGDSTAAISWTPPANNNGSTVTSYNVTAVDTTSAARGGQTCTTAATTCTVAGLTDGDTYYAVVVASNAAGPSTSATSSNFVPNGTPTAPSIVTATAGAGSAAVSWSGADGRGAPITSYTATAVDQTSPGRGGQTCTVTASTCTITGLTPNDSYVFTVTATNPNGTSAPSPASAPATPYAAPSGLTAPTATPGAGAATVTWTAPAANSSPITGYTVTAVDQTNPAGGGQSCSSSSATTCTVTGLTGGDSFTFTYVARNKAGTSAASPPSSPVIPYTSPVAPAAASGAPGDRSATITWSAPAGDGGSPVTGYTVTLTDSTTPSNGGQSFTGDAGTRNHVFTGLTNGDTYTASVTASNAAGPGPAATTASFVPFGAPAAPAAPAASQAGAGKALISWTAPNSNGAAINRYTATSGDLDNPAAPARSCTTPTGTSCTVAGLTGGHHYAFTVVASNTAGDSPASVASAPLLVIDVPSQPTNPAATSGTRSLSLSWAPPAIDGGSPITGYTIALTDSTTPSNGGQSFTGAAAIRSHTFTGLIAGDTYSAAVVATNAAGDSPPASSSATPYDAPTSPRAVSAVRGPAQVTVSWAAPAQTYGLAGLTYQVTVADADTPANGGQTCSTTSTSCTITGLTNGEHYTATVTATDAGGESAPGTSNTFVPLASPAAPAAPTAVPQRLSASITWTAPNANGSPITGYTATATDLDTPGDGGQSCAATTTSCTVAGLTLGDRYTFTVVASNSIGDSLASPASAAVTPFDVPAAPSAPHGAPTKGGAIVAWSPPTRDNGSPVSSYTVTAADQGNPTHGGQTCTGTAGQTSCTLTGLTPGEGYTFTVVATNAGGDSPASPASAAITPDATTPTPGNVTISAGDRQATITWTAPPGSGASITGYTVALSDTTTPAHGGQTCSTTSTSCTLTGLVNGEHYTATVTATGPGGAAATTAGPFTPYGPPGAPGVPTATAGTSRATVAWAGADPNGYTGQNQRVSYTGTATDLDHPGNGGQACTTVATSCTVTGLTPGDRYTFTITAANDQSSGPASAASNPVTPYALPGRPPSVTAASGDHTATIAWATPSSDGYTPIVSYTVILEDSTVPAHGRQSYTGDTTTLSHVFTGLTDGELYRATVYASNAAGDGLATASAAFTPSGVPAAPTAPTAQQASPTSVVVAWIRPNQNASAITGYTVLFAAGAAGQACATTGADATSCTVNNLTTGTSYAFKVVATNSEGDSQTSSPSAPITLTAGSPCAGQGASTSSCSSVIVDGSIMMSLDPADQSFTLQGSPGSTASGPDNSISYIVTTNNETGYTVSVHADTPTLAAATPGNSETLATGSIVADGTALPGQTGSNGGRAVLDAGGVIYSQATRSDATGDEHRTLFTANLPFITSDSYTGSITFTATAN